MSIPSVLRVGLLVVLSSVLPLQVAFAQEEEEQQGGGLLDIDLGEIDLGEGKSLATESTYEGQALHSAPNYVAGTPVTISHSGGTVSVRCTDAKGLAARIQFKVDGTDQAAMKKLGDSIGIKTYASSANATVGTKVPGKTSGVTRVRADLVVTLPPQAQVIVNGATDWVQVLGCTGSVKASTKANGVFASGTYKSFDISSGTGNAEVELSDASVLTATSKASAPNGDVTLRVPLTQAMTLNASAETVTVAHLVNGTNLPNKVQGKVNGGGVAVTLTAKGKVDVTAPK